MQCARVDEIDVIRPEPGSSGGHGTSQYGGRAEESRRITERRAGDGATGFVRQYPGMPQGLVAGRALIFPRESVTSIESLSWVTPRLLSACELIQTASAS